SVQVGKDFTCALLTNGSVRCWGHNNHGQLGIGSKEDQHRPVTVQRLSHIKDIGLGAQHACAVAEDGSVYCWGANGFGQIGDGSLRERLSPVRINLPGPATHVTGGVYHTCARLQNGQVWCWGSNSQGELGNPSADVWSKVPVRVQGLNGPASDVDAGGLTTCAVVRGGVRCWGFNMYGQVGDGTYRSRATPVPVVGVNAGAKRVHVAFDHVCVQMDAAHGDRVLCWGSDAYGQLGRRRDLRWTRPIPLGETPPPYVQSDHTTGRVGSVFTLVGANFPTSAHGRVIINGRTVLTSLPVGESGQVRFFVNSQGADPGDYVVVVQVGSKRAAVVLRLTRTGVKYPGEGGGITVRVPSHSARHFHRQHMPHVVR
ncbi:MAG: hypothetical protein GXO55_10700, partial [Chloroflexi bacterium]|nr:hypothetical protein [Chloroflexota bacterium]